jgi:hypothetical protein
MLIKKDYIPVCDFCDKEVGGSGFAYVAMGASGRWCEVMWSCPECTGENRNSAITPEEARNRIKCPEWADF